MPAVVYPEHPQAEDHGVEKHRGAHAVGRAEARVPVGLQEEQAGDPAHVAQVDHEDAQRDEPGPAPRSSRKRHNEAHEQADRPNPVASVDHPNAGCAGEREGPGFGQCVEPDEVEPGGPDLHDAARDPFVKPSVRQQPQVVQHVPDTIDRHGLRQEEKDGPGPTVPSGKVKVVTHRKRQPIGNEEKPLRTSS